MSDILEESFDVSLDYPLRLFPRDYLRHPS